jgi:hypothetical protein
VREGKLSASADVTHRTSENGEVTTQGSMKQHLSTRRSTRQYCASIIPIDIRATAALTEHVSSGGALVVGVGVHTNVDQAVHT